MGTTGWKPWKPWKTLSLVLSLSFVLNLALGGTAYAEPEPLPDPVAAPTIDSTYAPVFAAIKEDSLGNDGMAISEMINGTVTSHTGSEGIAVIGMTGQGSWEAYYGGTWWNMEPLRPDWASMLGSNVKLRFIPAADWHGTATITYRAWDLRNDSGPNDEGRTKHDVTVNGGNTPYSAATQTASIVVESVNDEPRVIFPLTPKLLNFNGTTDYVTVNNLELKGEMTFEAWVYNNNPYAAWSRLFDFGNGSPGQNIMVGFHGGSGRMFLHNYTMNNVAGEIIVDEVFPASQWVHVEVVIDENGNGSIYWDGVLKKSGQVGTITEVKREINYIARSHWGQDAYFNGKIRDIRFWNKARTASEIAEDKNEILTGQEQGLVGYMPMLESEGTFLNDLTGRDISGNIIEADWVEDADAPLSVQIMANSSTEELLHGVYVTDPDAEDVPGAEITLAVSVPLGSIYVDAAGSGVSVIGGANDSASLTLRGSKTQVNHALSALVYTPPHNYFGMVKMSFTANDQGNSGEGGTLISNRALYITVLPIRITPIADQFIRVNTTTGSLTFKLQGGLVGPEQMVLTAESDNTGLVPPANIVLTGSGANRAVQITPVEGMTGRTKITLQVSDGTATSKTSFYVTVSEDRLSGWIEGDVNPVLHPGDDLTLQALSSTYTSKLTVSLGSEVLELVLDNPATFAKDGYKRFKLSAKMPFIPHGQQLAVFTAYDQAGNAVSPEHEELLDDNRFILYTPAAGVATKVDQITLTTAEVHTSIETDGGADVTERGIIYGLTQTLSLEEGTVVKAGAGGIAPFSTSLSGLASGTLYYARSYAVSEIGIAYGPIVPFRTLAPSVSSAPAATVALPQTAAGLSITDLIGSKLPVSGKLYSADGKPLSADMAVGKDGNLAFGALAPGQYLVVLTVTAPTGEKLAGQVARLTVDSSGKAVLEAELIDPYGTITDRITGKTVEGAKATLYWADTALNRAKGRIPGQAVALPVLSDFAPNQNKNPQFSSAEGQYGWMVYADGDYYIVAEADNYVTYDSRTDMRSEDIGLDSYIRDGLIHVGTSIVHYSFAIDPKPVAEGEHTPYLKGYPDQSFRPDRSLSRAELAAVLSRIMPAGQGGAASQSFVDVHAQHWAAASIALAVQQGWMSGYKDGSFAPDRKVTRAELTQALANIADWSDSPASEYADVQQHWAAKAIAGAQAAGLIAGFPDGSFKPDRTVTRAEAVKIFNKFLQRRPAGIPDSTGWKDVPKTHWSYADIMEASLKHPFKQYATGIEVWE